MRSQFIKFLPLLIFTLFFPLGIVRANAPDMYGSVSSATGAPIPPGVVVIDWTDSGGGGTVLTPGDGGSFYFCSCQGSQIYGNHCNACNNNYASCGSGCSTGWCTSVNSSGYGQCGGHGCNQNPNHFGCTALDGGSCSGGFSYNVSNSETQAHPGDFTYYPPRTCGNTNQYCQGTTYPNNYGENSCTGTNSGTCDGSGTCVGKTASGTCGSTCQGTKVCDTSPPTVSIVGFPASQCFTPSYWNSSFTQPLKMQATDDTSVDNTTPRFRVHKVSDGSSSSNDVIMSATSVSGSGYNYQSSTSSSNPFNSLASRLDPGSNATAYILTAEAKDSVGLLGNSAGINFTFSNNCTTPYLKTQGGDVHSNTGISVNGGPSPSPTP